METQIANLREQESNLHQEQRLESCSGQHKQRLQSEILILQVKREETQTELDAIKKSKDALITNFARTNKIPAQAYPEIISIARNSTQ